ncbi:hypothetical protein OC844_004322 [Tilletia horrida]|nr:hypothetical protein OC844_004322 [Tilletia horrida]
MLTASTSPISTSQVPLLHKKIWYDRGTVARLLCPVGFLFSCCIVVLSLCLGVWLQHYATTNVWILDSPSRYGLKAAITVVTTVCIKSMAYVHNISLRWALFHEGKLRFNSNLRLVQHCRNSPANSWFANLACFLGVVVCYFAAAVIVLECETVKDRTMYVTLPQTLIAYALAMLAQVVVTALALPSAYRAPTFTCNPLDTAAAALTHSHAEARNRLVRRDGRCLMGVERHSDPSEPTRPKRWQPSIFRAHKDLRPWIYILRSGDDVASIAFDGTLDPETGKSLLPDLAFSKLFAIAAGPQMPLALLLHASERLVNCIRDEAAWRKMAHKRGTRRESANPLVAFLTSPPAVLLFLIKNIVHFSYIFTIQVSADRSTSKEVESIPGLDQAYFHPYFHPYIVTALAFWPRKGPQPATYGHLQTIVDLIDEWPKHGEETMYWGHKAGGTGWKETEPVNHAGVLSAALGPFAGANSRSDSLHV